MWRQVRLIVRTAAALALAIGLVDPRPANASDPKVPPGIDPGGATIAVLGTGVDYTEADIAARLARDGEGELVGWDFADNDPRPYAPSPNATPMASGGDGTALLRRLLAARDTGEPSQAAGRATPMPKQVRIIPLRIDPTRPASLAEAVVFAVRAGAATIVVPLSSPAASTWEPFRQAAAQLRTVEFLVPGCDGPPAPGFTLYPLALDLPNVRAWPAPDDGAPGASPLHVACSATGPQRP